MLTTAACAARRSPFSRRSWAVAVPVVLTKCSRSPGTRRDIRYWTQSASPTQTGDDVDRRCPWRASPFAGRPRASKRRRPCARGARSPARPLPSQEKPTRLNRFGVCSGGETNPLIRGHARRRGRRLQLELDDLRNVGAGAQGRCGQRDGGAQDERGGCSEDEAQHSDRNTASVGSDAPDPSANTPLCSGFTRYGTNSGALSRYFSLNARIASQVFSFTSLQRRMWPVVVAHPRRYGERLLQLRARQHDHVVGVLLVERLELRQLVAGQVGSQPDQDPAVLERVHHVRDRAAPPRRCRPRSAPGSGGRAPAAPTCT